MIAPMALGVADASKETSISLLNLINLSLLRDFTSFQYFVFFLTRFSLVPNCKNWVRHSVPYTLYVRISEYIYTISVCICVYASEPAYMEAQFKTSFGRFSKWALSPKSPMDQILQNRWSNFFLTQFYPLFNFYINFVTFFFKFSFRNSHK